MLNQETIRKKTLFIFFLVNIFSGLGGLLAGLRNGGNFLSPSTIAQFSTIVISISSALLIFRMKRYKLMRNISFFLYSIMVLMMWYTLGSANPLFIVYTLFFVIIVLNTISSRRRMLVSIFTMLVAMILVYIDTMFRSGDTSLYVFTQSHILGLIFIAPGLWATITYQLNVIDNMVRKLSNFSYHDQMSGAKNRRALYRDFDIHKSNNKAITIIYIDINKLKYINDNFGHSYGDLAIIETIKSISKTFGDRAEVYRLGGDEFAMIVHEMSEKKICETLDSIKCKVDKDSVSFNVTFSYGLFETGGELQLSELLVKADRKMYVSKRIETA